MKSITIKSILVFAIVCMAASIKISKQDLEKRVDSKCFKSPGEFSNVAPEATHIVSPKLASKFNVSYLY